MNFIFKKIEKNEVTEDQINQIVTLEGKDGYTKKQIESIWKNENFINDNFVCIYNGEIVGDISFNPNSKRRKGSVYMVNLTVSPNYRRMGIAQNLIYAAGKYYKKKEINIPMSLSVDKDNIKAINLYKKVGYEIKEPICYEDLDDEQYIMEAELGNLLLNLNSLKINAEEKHI